MIHYLQLILNLILTVQLESLTQNIPMIDKLTMATNEIEIDKLINEFESKSVQFRNNQYLRCIKLIQNHTGQHLCSVYTKPILPINEVRIELNPSKLNMTYSKLIFLLDKCIDIDSTLIQRIDHASDINMNVEEAFNTVRFKFKRKMMLYSDSFKGYLTGFYIGSKHEQIAIYDKRFQLHGRNFKPNPDHSSIVNLTRFEIRQKFQAIPYRHLKELPNLMNYDPFKNIETYELAPLKAGLITNGWKGLHSTYQELNTHNNIKRDFKKYLIASDLRKNITNNYWYNLGQFFMETRNENA